MPGAVRRRSLAGAHACYQGRNRRACVACGEAPPRKRWAVEAGPGTNRPRSAGGGVTPAPAWHADWREGRRGRSVGGCVQRRLYGGCDVRAHRARSPRQAVPSMPKPRWRHLGGCMLLQAHAARRHHGSHCLRGPCRAGEAVGTASPARSCRQDTRGLSSGPSHTDWAVAKRCERQGCRARRPGKQRWPRPGARQ